MTVVHFADQSQPLEALETRGARAARALAEGGIEPRGVIALLMRNEPAFIEALTCLRCLEGVRVLIPWHLAPQEIARILAVVRPRLLIGHTDLLAPLAEVIAGHADMHVAAVEPHPELVRVYELQGYRGESAATAGLSRWKDLTARGGEPLPIPVGAPQALSLTSGSTGAPKVIRWAGRQQWEQLYPGRTAQRPPIHTSIVTAPLYHGAQYGLFSQAWRLRANLVILPKFDAEAFLAAVETRRVNHAYMVPTMFARLLKLPRRLRESYDVRSLDYVLHSGAPCPAHVKRAMIEWFGPVLWEAYGCSESSTVSVCTSAEWLARPGTVGRPVRGVAIVDEQGEPCPAGGVGRVGIDVSALPPIAYSGLETPRFDTPHFERDGRRFIPSGDVGYLDADGYLYLAGRADELINTGRVKVHPEEIESVILAHPEVLDCCVFAIPDEEFGEVIGAIVEVARMPWGEFVPDMRTFLEERISEHKIPVRIWQEAALLRNEAGKFNRHELRERLLAANRLRDVAALRGREATRHATIGLSARIMKQIGGTRTRNRG